MNSGWIPWLEFKPTDDYFTGNVKDVSRQRKISRRAIRSRCIKAQRTDFQKAKAFTTLQRHRANKQANILQKQAKDQAAKDSGFPSSLSRLLCVATKRANTAIQEPRQEWSPPKLPSREMQEEMENGLEASDVAGTFEKDEDGLTGTQL